MAAQNASGNSCISSELALNVQLPCAKSIWCIQVNSPLKSITAHAPNANSRANTSPAPAIRVRPACFLLAMMASAISPATAKPPTTPTDMRPVVNMGVQSRRWESALSERA